MQSIPPIPVTDVQKRRLGLMAAVLLVTVLAGFAVASPWLFDAQGRLVVSDFVSGWSASRSIGEGVPAEQLYDWEWHVAAQRRHLGYAFEGQYGWQYPPYALLLVWPLGLMGFGAAWLCWLAVTGGAFACVVRYISGHWAAVPLLLLFPASLWNASAGQNGFLTAALTGGCIWLLDRRPAWAGILLGLLSFKPQLGLVFPLVLLFERRWRTFWAATATVLSLVALSLMIFGPQAWLAFFEALPVVSQKLLGEGEAGFHKLHSIYGWARLAGMEGAAMPLQVLCAAVAVVWVLYIRRHAHQPETGNAALALAPLLMTPYIWIYDMALMAVALAFLLRLGWREGFLPLEREALWLVALLLGIYPQYAMPWGFVCAVLVAALLTRRARQASRAAICA